MSGCIHEGVFQERLVSELVNLLCMSIIQTEVPKQNKVNSHSAWGETSIFSLSQTLELLDFGVWDSYKELHYQALNSQAFGLKLTQLAFVTLLQATDWDFLASISAWINYCNKSLMYIVVLNIYWFCFSGEPSCTIFSEGRESMMFT